MREQEQNRNEICLDDVHQPDVEDDSDSGDYDHIGDDYYKLYTADGGTYMTFETWQEMRAFLISTKKPNYQNVDAVATMDDYYSENDGPSINYQTEEEKFIVYSSNGGQFISFKTENDMREYLANKDGNQNSKSVNRRMSI